MFSLYIPLYYLLFSVEVAIGGSGQVAVDGATGSGQLAVKTQREGRKRNFEEREDEVDLEIHQLTKVSL